jgi:hypothetical protein
MSVIEELPDPIKAAIAAHGGAERWNQLIAVEATVSAWGFLFTAKRRPVMQRVRVRAWTREIRFAFHDFPRAGETSELIGDQEVRVVGRDGEILARREEPRSALRNWRRQLYWDHLDFVYFGGYATWNYFRHAVHLPSRRLRVRGAAAAVDPHGALVENSGDLSG